MLRKYNIEHYEKNTIDSNERKPKGQSAGNFWWQRPATQNDEYGYLSRQRDYKAKPFRPERSGGCKGRQVRLGFGPRRSCQNYRRNRMINRIFLLGNPNVGKSVVFSRLTGVHVIASNYPGTTVEISKGYLKIGEERVEVIDLPGTYSFEPTSKAEEVAISLLKEYPKYKSVVINILDATNLERNLFLTLQLIEEGFSVIVCLNMCDDAAHRGFISIRKNL
jgi:small GTP-binding protein